MDEVIRRALSRGQVIDITTIGRRTGQPRRIEIVYHVFGSHIYISGLPSRRTRAWIHNLQADPNFTVHLKGPEPIADLPASARVITDEAERRRILEQVARVWRRTDVDVMVRFAPLIEVTIAGYTDVTAA
jgi:deazaflavin-dependent oxidoreductase (nitroreductase family)